MTDQHDQLNAWGDGELPPDAAARFERESGLNEARQWLAADAPGLERVDELTAPRIPSPRNPKSAIRNLRWAWQMAAAATIFVGGFALGRIGAPITPPTQPAAHVVQIETPMPTPESIRVTPQLAAFNKPPRQVRQEDGRVIIETTLADSGAQATWVIDGSFKLASNETKAH